MRAGARRRGSEGGREEDTQGKSVTLPGCVVLKNPVIVVVSHSLKNHLYKHRFRSCFVDIISVLLEKLKNKQ